MNRLSLWMAAVALIACAVVTAAQGQRPMPGGPDGHPGPTPAGVALAPSAVLAPPPPQLLAQLADVVELTDTQAGKLEQIIQTSNQKLQTARQAAAKAMQALRSGLVNPAVDTPKLKELAASAQKADAALAAVGLDVWIQIRSILDADQLTALQQLTGPRPGGPGGPQRPDGPPMEGQPLAPPPAR